MVRAAERRLHVSQVLQAAEQVAEGHAGHLEAAEENAYTEEVLAAETRRC